MIVSVSGASTGDYKKARIPVSTSGYTKVPVVRGHRPITSFAGLCNATFNVNGAVAESVSQYSKGGEDYLRVSVRPRKGEENRCPICGAKCPGYDQHSDGPSIWRDLDAGSGAIVEFAYETHRVCCPEHGVVRAAVPWAYHGSRFTKQFDNMATHLALWVSKTEVSDLMRIDWKTVGRCIDRAHKAVEPDLSARLKGLVRIGVDETSYKKGHKYITIVLNHDTNEVVWVAEGHGLEVFRKFCELLTTEQREAIKLVSGDGAQWITTCTEQYFPNACRAADAFHVVSWAQDALDQVRREQVRLAKSKLDAFKKKHPDLKKGDSSSLDDPCLAALFELEEAVSRLGGSMYPVRKNPDHLTENQTEIIEWIMANNKPLRRAYQLKEGLRLAVTVRNSIVADGMMGHWIQGALACKLKPFKELAKKIQNHRVFILNAIRNGVSNARVEAMNRTIKLVIHRAYGFRNLDSLFAMIYLVGSNIKIPLPNRMRPTERERREARKKRKKEQEKSA